MNFELNTLDMGALVQDSCDALILLVADGFKPGKDKLSSMVTQATKAGDLQSKPGKALLVYHPVSIATPRLVLAGVGDATARSARIALQAAMSTLKTLDASKITVAVAGASGEGILRALMYVVADSTYVYTTTKPKAEVNTVKFVKISLANASALQSVFERVAATIDGVELAKEWGNRPANHATPTLLAKAAQALAKHPRISCQVLGPKEVSQLGMGAFTAVAQGSDEPLRLIVLQYKGAEKSKAPTVLVGKGITFDSGGISIKPAAEMDEMKFDMCGAASVLGVFAALAKLTPGINVVGVIPACENLVNGRAVKPGDVVTSMSGQTIEILNTDAEGRLVLCDALTYAERFKPAAVIDIATLTGACVVALGNVRSGMFCPDDAMAQALVDAGDAAQDYCWRLPLDDEYADGLKTNFADLANVAGRAGGAISAAKFLQRFADKKYPWAHLDIAGTAWKSGAAKGATGRPVPLLVEYLTR